MAEPSFQVDGNRLTLLTDGAARWKALIAMVEAARTSVRALYYIYADDEAGRAFGDALIAARRRGVAVTLIVDGFGSDTAQRSALFAPLIAAGVALCVFSPRFGRRYLLRNHQKLLLVDGESDRASILIGGFNIEDDYFGSSSDHAWRDLGLRVEGPAARRMLPYYDALHAWIRRPEAKLRHLNRTLRRFSEREGSMRWLIGGPTRRLSPWARTVRSDMRRARRIDVIAGYFTPSPTMLRRLDHAGRRDAEVRVVTASQSDNAATIAAARFTYAGLLRKGVRIFEYAATKLHTKLYVVDEAVHVGSANFDMRSLFINLELMLRIEDAAFASHVRAYVDGEIGQSREVTEAAYRAQTGWWQRLRQLTAYLLIAVLDPNVSRGLNFGVDA